MTEAVATVIPTYGAAPFLAATLASLERQTLTPEEVVVVDDGSPMPVCVPPGPLRPKVLRIEHAGIAGARNAGVTSTTAPLVHICDHDDLLEPTFFAKASAVFETQPSVDVVYATCGFIDDDGASLPGCLPYRDAPCGDSEVVAGLLSENYIGSIAAVFRREAFNRVGGFRGLDYVQDWDFWLRLASTGSRFEHIPETLAWHRVHPGQQSREGQRVRILEESLDMVGSLRLPVNMWPARRRALVSLHLQASRVLRARGESGSLRHLLSAVYRRPLHTSALALRSLATAARTDA